MNSPFRVARLARVAAGMVLISTLAAPAAIAHTEQHIGDFHALVGWVNEPALAGQPNAVQLTITDHDEHPVTDLGPDDIEVVVSTAGQDSPALPMTPAFSVEEGWGTPGEYHAQIFPTAPGEYTFHFTGTIHDTAVDLEVTSGPETFASIEGTSELEFPVKQPTLTEVGTRLDRIDGRVQALQSAAPGTDALAAATAAAKSASDAADRALWIGVIVGGAGLVLAVVAISMAMRARTVAGAA